MREPVLPIGTRRAALLALLAGVVVYIWFAETRFFQQASLLSLFLLIFIPLEIVLILIVRRAASAVRSSAAHRKLF